MPKLTINVDKIILELGGPRKAKLKLQKCGYEISESGIRKWISRNSIPFHRFLEVFATLEKLKYEPPKISEFIIEESESY